MTTLTQAQANELAVARRSPDVTTRMSGVPQLQHMPRATAMAQSTRPSSTDSERAAVAQIEGALTKRNRERSGVGDSTTWSASIAPYGDAWIATSGSVSAIFDESGGSRMSAVDARRAAASDGRHVLILFWRVA